MITAHWYGTGMMKLAQGAILWESDSIKAALLDATYVPSEDSHAVYADLTGEVPASGGYVTGGSAITNKSLTYDSVANDVYMLGDDITYPNSTITCRYVVLYEDAAVGSKWLLAYFDLGEDQVSDDSLLALTFSSRRILKITTP